MFWHSFKQFEHNWLVVAFAPKSYRSDPRKFIWAVNSGQMPKCYHNLWGVMRYRSTKSRSVTDARHSSELFSLFMFETWFNEVVWKCDRWPQTEESQLASQLQNCREYWFNLAIMYCREYWFNLAIMDHFCNAGDSNLAPTAGSAKVSDFKKMNMLCREMRIGQSWK